MSDKEANFWGRLSRGLWAPRSVLTRVENGVMVGMPDVYYCFDGTSGWIELKAPTAPARKNSKLFGSSHQLTLQQRNWLDAHREAGGRGWIAIETEDYVALLDASWACNLNVMTLEEALRAAEFSAPRPLKAPNWARMRAVLARRAA